MNRQLWLFNRLRITGGGDVPNLLTPRSRTAAPALHNPTLWYGVGSAASVTTWSPLATTFNAKPAPRQFNDTQNRAGLFNIPELRTADGFRVLNDNVIRHTDRLIDEAIGTDRQRKLVSIFDELSDSLCKVADLAEFIRLAHPEPDFVRAATEACISVSGVVEKLNTHRQLYNTLRRSVDTGDIVPTSPMDQHVARLFLFDFEQCGIHLPEEQRQKVVYLNDVCLQLGQHFMNGAVQPRQVSKSVLPEDMRKYAQNFTTNGDDNVTVSGLYADSGNHLDREAAYRLYLYPDAEQEHLLTQLIGARHELATRCDFPTYAHRALNGSTAETPAMVDAFLRNLAAKLQPRANADFSAMAAMKRADTAGAQPLAAWDTPYYTTRYKKQFLRASASEFQPYFSLGSCMDGLNTLMTALYGIRLETVEMSPGESWATDVRKLIVRHDTEGELGEIYCDFFDRAGKPNQDCHFTIRGGKTLPDGRYQNPIVVVMLSLSAPRRWSGPTLLTPAMVDNLFHEMGHAMHSMLARTRYQHVTGTRCSTDFAEVPSVLMEYFASDPRVLATFARHFQTHEPMPADMMRRLCTSKHLFAASETQLQVFYSALDQAYHRRPDWMLTAKTTTDVLRNVQEEFYGLPYVADTAWQLRFSHLVGYGAKYYAYLMSRAIASWIWHRYFKADPFSREAGERYRRECLAHGGAVPSRQLVAQFLGKDVTAEGLAESLVVELDESRERIEELNGGGGKGG